jgi:hypothetical protein
MSFFILERDPADGSLRMLLSRDFSERTMALEALSAAVGDGSLAITGEVFVVDLSTAVPVLVMPTPPAPEPVAGVWEAPPGEAVEVEGEAAESASEPIEAPQDADETPGFGADVLSDLADALRRATSSLESEGVVAPGSIDSVEPEGESTIDESPAPVTVRPVGEVWPWANVDAYDASHPADEVVVVPEHDSPEREALGEEVPVSVIAEPVGVIEQMVDVADEDLTVADAGETLEEPEVQTSPLIVTSALDGEDAYMPRPLILGDYDESMPADETTELESENPIVDLIAPETDLKTAAPLSEAVEASAEASDTSGQDVVTVEEVALPDDIASGIGLAAPGTEPLDATTTGPAYVPAGELDLGEYTCEDCVYVNTCPKVGESNPAECGSFQWKA